MEELNPKDIYCIARIIQSSAFAEGEIFYGCQFCKYSNECKRMFENENGKMHYDVIKEKLQQITGLDMSVNASNLEEKFQRNFTTQLFEELTYK